MALSRSAYHRNHEPIFYATKETQAHRYGDRTHKTIIDQPAPPDFNKMKKDQLVEQLQFLYENSTIRPIGRDPGKYIHPTQKPVKLPSKAIKNSSPIRGVVLEPFSGSGSTLIACEATKRKCYAMDLDPKYVQLAIIRRQDLTGQEAVIIS